MQLGAGSDRRGGQCSHRSVGERGAGARVEETAGVATDRDLGYAPANVGGRELVVLCARGAQSGGQVGQHLR